MECKLTKKNLKLFDKLNKPFLRDEYINKWFDEVKKNTSPIVKSDDCSKKD